MVTWRAIEAEGPRLDPGQVHIWRIRLDPGTPPDIVERNLRLLSPDEAERAARFVTERLRRAFVLAHGGLRRILSLYTGTPPESLEFVQEGRGKPVLRDPGARSGTPHFNLSHSGDLALLGVSTGPLGVDVEHLRPVADAERIAARFFSAAESEALRSLPPCERQDAFFRCWTRKEAFIKAIGEGLSHPLAGFDVSLLPGQPPEILRIADAPEETAEWSLCAFEPADGYLAAVAVRQQRPELSFYELL